MFGWMLIEAEIINESIFPGISGTPFRYNYIKSEFVE